MRGVQLLEPLACHVRVDLRGRQVAVAKQHLHHAQVRAVVQQVSGEGVPQRVRMNRFGDGGGLR